ncbi:MULTISPECIES: LysR family transcriptional regulator [unclassified Leucobacter]
MDVPELAELELLDAVARTGSLSAAARELGVSQQAVSSRLRGMERRLGLPLVSRSAAGAVPTETGSAVLAGAREVLAAARRLAETVDGLRGTAGRALAVAASQTIAAHLLPGWVLDMRRAQADRGRAPAETELRTGNSAEVIRLVREGRADLGFIESPLAPSGLAVRAVRTDRMVLVVAPDHPWARRERGVALAELADTPLVAREVGSGTREAFETEVRRRLGRAPAAPAVVLSTEAAVRSAVAGGLGPAVLSDLTVADDLRLGRMRAVEMLGEPITRPLAAVWRGSERDLFGAARDLVGAAAAQPRA